jgi:CBS domain-containing protein
LDKGELVGIISIGDVVRQMIVEQKMLIEQLEAYIRG